MEEPVHNRGGGGGRQDVAPANTVDIAAEIAAIQPRLYGFLFKRLADRDQTAEVLQRTNVVLCRKMGELDADANVLAWALTVAKFQVMAWRQTAARDRLVFADDVAAFVDRDLEEDAAAIDSRVAALRACLRKLAEADRTLIQARYRDGSPVRAIADGLAKSADSVAMRLMRLRQRLRDCVQAQLLAEAYE